MSTMVMASLFGDKPPAFGPAIVVAGCFTIYVAWNVLSLVARGERLDGKTWGWLLFVGAIVLTAIYARDHR